MWGRHSGLPIRQNLWQLLTDGQSMVELNLLSLGFFGILVSQTVFALLIDRLNFEHRRRASRGESEPPADGDVSGNADYEDALSYRRIRFIAVRKAVRDIALIALIVSGALSRFDLWLNQRDYGFIFGGVVFFAGVVLFFLIIDVPFQFYRTSALREAGNRDKDRAADWVGNVLKEWGPRMLVVGFLSCAGLFFIKLSPDRWWLWSLPAGVAVQFYLTVLYPSVLEPLSMKAEPIVETDLLQELNGLAQRAGLSNVSFFRFDSPESASAGAYCVGVGRIRRIFLSNRMLSMLDDQETLALVAHEIGHFRKRHILVAFVLGVTATCVVLACTFLLTQWDTLNETFGFDPTSLYPALFVIAVFWRRLGFFFKPAYMAMLRQFERQADGFSAELMKTGTPLASALTRITEQGNKTPDHHPLYAWFHLSHPPLRQRLVSLGERPEPIA